ncbi:MULTISPECIES: hypothetical protein [unclassified Tolypothrix]|nr:MULTISPECIES: hypothetical protein [unclassified Tolypothrix]BAY95913.1 hypothetical protein NIES3275_79900 [Microchaete diplosiphon NIES-3275]EKE96551.1 hypothetical protein FDUTEX481_06560 [Tolypothrix sp. PCC 7601]MBE9084715.1 hypothetical protein [Tolypothrix sp. LEGE 11397]UYD30939.1 hypothetical protein HGR01_39475 [Tolypothrix sp. PCC 7712]UYD38801.1 hypothetical protein HG267_40635 [Tolypothrix sp. PCC 7601]
MFTLREQLNPDCGSDRVSISYTMSVISGFDIKIDNCGGCGAAVFVKAS